MRSLEGLVPADPRLRAQLAEGGQAYQRLEWLGDSVLDVLVTTRLVKAEPVLASDGLGWLQRQRVARVSDAALGARGRRMGLRGSGELIADTVEALIGAAFCEGGWPRAAAVAEQTALAGLGNGNRRLRSGLLESAQRSRLAWVGEAVIEAAAAIHLHGESPHLSEGGLTRARVQLTATDSVEARAAEVWPALPQSSIRYVRAELGDAAIGDGVPTAVLLAYDLFG